jgi:hypothetical protein
MYLSRQNASRNATIEAGKMTLRVNSCRGRHGLGCPLCSRKLPRLLPARAAVKGQKETYALQQTPPYSMISSARPSSGSGIVNPSVLAVLRLTTSSIFVDSWTGNSAGVAPLRIRPA